MNVRVEGPKVAQRVGDTARVEHAAACQPQPITKVEYGGGGGGGGGAVISVNGRPGAVTLTSADVGLPLVDNTPDALKPISAAVQAALDAKLSSSAASAFGLTLLDDADAATARTTLALSNVENKSSATIRSEITSGNVTTALGFTPENAANKGAANGYAPLVSGLVPSIYLPAYVDEVLDFANLASFPVTGETGKIYVAAATNKQYRWSGSVYVELVSSPGTTDDVPEGAVNKYHTAQRVRDVVLVGANKSIVFNDNGAAGADGRFTYDKATNTLIVGGKLRLGESQSGQRTVLEDAPQNAPGESFALVYGGGVAQTNGPPGQENYVDHVWAFGYNLSGPEVPNNLDRPCFGVVFEGRYVINGVFGQEFHLAHRPLFGPNQRMISIFAPDDLTTLAGRQNQIFSLQANRFALRDSEGGEYLGVFHVPGVGGTYGVWAFGASEQMTFNRAGAPLFYQLNTAGNAYLQLPFYNASSRLAIAQALSVNGFDVDFPATGGTLATIESPSFSGVPTAPTAALGTNTTQLASTAFVAAALANLAGTAPAVLDTLAEIATALGNDPNFATTVLNALAGKAPTVHGHTSSEISDFAAAARAQVEAMLQTGANITLAYSGVGATRQVSIAAAAGGGGSVFTRATLNVPFTRVGYAEVVVSVPGVAPTEKIVAFPVGELDAENDLEEIQDSNVRIFGVAETNQVRFVVQADAPIVGQFKVDYQRFT